MIIDGHVHYGGLFAEVDNLLQSMDNSGVDKVVAVPYMFKDGLDVSTSSLPIWLAECNLSVFFVDLMIKNRWFKRRFVERPDNSKVLKLMEQFPGRVMGFFWVNPKNVEDIGEMESMIAQGHFAGIKMHQVIHPFDIRAPYVQIIFDIANKYRVPVFLHLADRDSCKQLVSIAKTRPKAKFIIAHLINHLDTLHAVTKLDNLYYDISPLCIPKTHKIYDVVRTAGAEKLIFGSDAPCPGGQNHALKKVLDLDLTWEEKTAILGGNLAGIIQGREALTLPMAGKGQKKGQWNFPLA